MKTHRLILAISFIVTIITLLIILLFSMKTKMFNISLAIMGSSIISFMLEIPSYYSIKTYNKNRLYVSLFQIKNQILILENMIDEGLNSNNTVNSNFYENCIDNISPNIESLRNFDPYYYLFKHKNNAISNQISILITSFWNLHNSCKKFELNHIKKAIDIMQKEKKQRLIYYTELQNDLLAINKMYTNLLENVEKLIISSMNKKMIERWNIDDLNIKNAILSSKVTI